MKTVSYSKWYPLPGRDLAPHSGQSYFLTILGKTTRAGAIAGMIAGGATVFIWKLLLNPLGGIFGIYELLPAFLISCVAIIITSLLSEGPSEDVRRSSD